jgi:transcriptional regulator with XRE-family HTH domain
MEIQAVARLNLKKQRTIKKLSQQDIADRLHIDLKTYQNLENGKTKFDLSRLGDLTKALELSSEFDLLESEALYLHQEIHNNTRFNIFNKEATVEPFVTSEIIELKDKIIEEKNQEIARLWDLLNKLSPNI